MIGRNESPPHRDTPRRTEPVLGDLGDLDAPTSREKDAGHAGPGGGAPSFHATEPAPFSADEHARTPHRPPRRRGLWITCIVVLVLIIVGGLAWTNQSTLRAWLPQTQLNALLTRADKALAADDLAGGPDSARDLYEAARALDPDNERALTGLHKVGEAELKRAQSALKQHHYSTARTALEEARSLLGGGAEVDAVDKALAKAVLHSANIDVLINQARAALANGRIEGNDGAAALFGKVLAGEPDNAVARHGMNQIGDVLANHIQTQLGSGDRAGARKTLQELAGLLPRYAQLPSLRASIATADRAAGVKRDQALAQGQADLRAGKITGNDGDNAEALFKAALAADPGNAAATAGLGQVAEALIVQANAALDSGHPGQARALLNHAATLAPKSADLAAARSRLAAGAGPQVAAAGSTASPSGTTPAQSARVARLVLRAQAAARKGEIMLPPGNSAYDLYRAALGIDGNNARAQAGLRALPGITRQEFQQALAGGNLEHAHDMLSTLEQLDPGDPLTTTMRHRLGSAWLDRADHDARLGRTAAARTALHEAQQLVPQDPRISEVDARIHEN